MGYRHKKDRIVKMGSIQYWRCVRQGCPGRVHTLVSDNRVTYYREHSHCQDVQGCEVVQFKAAVCAKAAENRDVSLHQVHNFSFKHFHVINILCLQEI